MHDLYRHSYCLSSRRTSSERTGTDGHISHRCCGLITITRELKLRMKVAVLACLIPLFSFGAVSDNPSQVVNAIASPGILALNRSPIDTPERPASFSSYNSGALAPKGDCVTDDWAALQAMLNTHRFIYLEKPIGACYLVSRTLILQSGDHLFGASANNPNTPNNGVVIRLAPNSNVPLLQTFDALGPAGGGNEFMAIENIAFDGNGGAQTRELQGQALVDYRGTFIQTFLRHVLITNSFGPALFTGSTQLDNVWLIANSTSTYAWIHNPGKRGLGALMASQVYVEESIKPNSGHYRSPWGGSVNDPTAYAHAIWFNGMGSATVNQLHCESAATCLDINDIQSLTISGISGTRIGNPASPDPTDQDLIRALNTNIYNITFSGAYFDQSGSTFQGSFANSRVFGLARGIDSNDIYQTPPGKCAWPFYTWGLYDQGFSGVPYLGERPVVSNELWIQQTGNFSPNRLAIWDKTGGPAGSYAYLERQGRQLNLGFSPGPLDQNEVTMLQLNFFGLGNSANNVQINGGRIQTGTESNTDLDGELAIYSFKSATYSFAGYYLVHPECTVTPQFDIGPNNRFWITYTGASSFSVNFESAVTGSVSYICFGRQ